jgi:ribonuclease Z
MKLTLLGTGTPVPDTQRRGPSQVIESGGELILIDCGAGALHRLMEAGYTEPAVKCIVLTHLHSDHITGLADVLWAGWSRWWDRPRIVGPPGTAQFVARLYGAFEYDIQLRTEAGRSSEGATPLVEEVEEGWSTSGGDWQLSAFRVDHFPVDQAFGYRVEGSDGSIAVSGDTRYSENLIRHAQDADLLLHEVYLARTVRERLQKLTEPGLLSRERQVASYHTPSDEVGKVAAAANARHLVLSHLILRGGPSEELRSDVEATYRGQVTVGNDLLSFEVK